MMSLVPFIFNQGLLVIVLDDGPVHVAQSHPSYNRIKALLKVDNSQKQIKELLNVNKAVSFVTGGKVTVRDGNVFLDGEAVHNTVSNRIMQFYKEGLPFEPLVRFLEKLTANPSYQSQQELYDFLENKSLPITEDGDFLAYKAVQANWYDKYSGTIDNSPGRVVKMERSKVDDNRGNECSKGLHCGALDYVAQYGNGSDDRIVIVKVNPAHAVSVPKDYSYQKLRVCQYTVVKEFEGELTRAAYRDDATSFDSGDVDDYDDDFEDGDVVSSSAPTISEAEEEALDAALDDLEFGVKPSGQRYHNKRDAGGRFASR